MINEIDKEQFNNTSQQLNKSIHDELYKLFDLKGAELQKELLNKELILA